MKTSEFLLGAILVVCLVSYFTMNPLSTEPVIKGQPPAMICYSPFDVYVAFEYEVTDDNATLITSHGRVYHLEDCRLYEEGN